MKLFIAVLGVFSLQTHVYGINFTVPSKLCQSQATNDMLNYFGSISAPRICLNTTYIPGHANRNFLEKCLVQPDNGELSFVDSVWTYYKCTVTKSLGSIPLTITSYAEWMAGNMSAHTKSVILSFLNETQNESKLTETNLNSSFSEISELRNLEKYWNAYFDAEYHACRNNSLIPCEDKYKLKYNWSPKHQCSDKRNIPDIYFFHLNYSYNKINCSSSIVERHTSSTNKTRVEILNAAFWWCDAVSLGEMDDNQNENEILDFEPFYNELMTRSFYSKKVQQVIFNLFKKRFSKVYSKQNKTIIESESVKDMFSYAVQHLQVKYVEEGHIPENLNFLINGNLLGELYSFGRYFLQHKLCYPDPDET